MSGDYSRLAFDSRRDYNGVLLQQGRPLTDWDWNDSVAETSRRIQAGTYDTFGGSVVPRTTPAGFAIAVSGGALTIGRGRMYVDGVLAENHGAKGPAWDAVLAEAFGPDPVPFAAQPYWPGAPALPTAGTFLAYVDVWLREVTPLERPDLVEPALGVDTTARLQVAWQVRLLDLRQAGPVDCGTADDKLPGWTALTAPSAGRLTTATGAQGVPTPCLIPPQGGYKGLENQLYRVEIQKGGAAGTATFKWSRDNGSVTVRALSVVGANRVVVDSTGKDTLLRVNPGDWIEMVDDVAELGVDPATGRPRHVGQLYRIASGGVDDATRTITLEAPLDTAAFPADAQGRLDPDRHTRIRRWDQRGHARRADGTDWADVDAGGGQIPVPPAGTQVQIENGILVSFDMAVAGGQVHSGDWWVFAARAGDAADIEHLDQAPPRGVPHHYARLAIVSFPGNATDCRVLWPPVVSEGTGCGCTVCVSPDQHNQGSYPLQKALDDVKATGGTVCLLPGRYRLRAPLTIDTAHAVAVGGQGAATVLDAPAGAFLVTSSTDVHLRDFAVEGPPESGAAGYVAIAANSVTGFSAERLEIEAGPRVPGAIGIALGGVIAEAIVRENRITTAVGIAARVAPAAGPAGTTGARALATANLVIDDNLLQCTDSAIRFEDTAVTQLLTRLRGNRILGCRAEGVLLAGRAATDAAVEIAANHLSVAGDGIVCGPGAYRIADNDLMFTGAASTAHEGIAVRPGRDAQTAIGDYQIAGNRVAGFPTAGVAIHAAVRTAMVERNAIEKSACGIRADGPLPSAVVVADDNRIADLDAVAPAATTGAAAQRPNVLGIAITNATVARVADNTLSGVGLATRDGLLFAGIEVFTSERVTVAGNDVSRVGPPGDFAGIATGIAILQISGAIQVVHNTVRRRAGAADQTPVDASPWMPLMVLGVAPPPPPQSNPPTPGAIVTAVAAAPLDALRLLRFDQVRAAAEAAAAAPLPRPFISVEGNELEGGGRIGIAMVAGLNDCTFTANQCVHLSPARLQQGTSDVRIDAAALIAADNRVLGGPDSLDLRLLGGSAAVSVLGNLTRGKITINGAPLAPPSPWAPINVQGV